MRPGDPLPVDPTHLTPDVSVSEIIMSPEITPLLQAAQAKGCRINPGRSMLENQVRRLEHLLDLR